MPMPRFAAIGLDHRHIYDLTQGLLAAGAVAPATIPIPPMRACSPDFASVSEVPAGETERLLDDPSSTSS